MQNNVIFVNPDGQTAAVGTDFSAFSPELVSNVLSAVLKADTLEQGTIYYFAPRASLILLTIMGFVFAASSYDVATTLTIGGYFLSLLIATELRLESAADSFCAFKFKHYNQTIQHFFFKDCAATVFVFTPLAYIFSIGCFVVKEPSNVLPTESIHACILGTMAILLTLSGIARSLQKKYYPPATLPLRDRLIQVTAEFERGQHIGSLGAYAARYP